MTEFANEEKEFVIEGYWNNVFTGGIIQPTKYVSELGWELVSMVQGGTAQTISYIYKKNKAHMKINGHIDKYTSLLKTYLRGTHSISLSFGEGWDMPIVDSIGIGIVPFLSDNTAHLEYSAKEFILPASEQILTPAKDGLFFDGEQGCWWEPKQSYLGELQEKISEYIFTHEYYMNGEYLDLVNVVTSRRNVLQQLATAFKMV